MRHRWLKGQQYTEKFFKILTHVNLFQILTSEDTERVKHL